MGSTALTSPSLPSFTLLHQASTNFLPASQTNPTNRATETMRPSQIWAVSPNTMYPTKDAVAAKRAYGNWVLTWSMWSHSAPADESTVVSEIGELWSPKTAPAKTAAIAGNTHS